MAGPGPVVDSGEDAALVLRAVATFLAARPTETNPVATILTTLASHPGVGRFWWVGDGQEVAAVAMQVPKGGGRAELTPGPGWAIDALADAMAEDVPELSAVLGEAGAASRFAGRWAERRGLPVAPVEAGRLYVLGDLVAPPPVAGGLRRAGDADADLVADWAAAFGSTSGDPAGTVAEARHRLAGGRMWLWDEDVPVSMVSAPVPVNGVARVGLVYTPPERRSRGYAAAAVAALSRHLLAEEAETCILYTQLSNPTSNAIYQRLGYRAVAESLIYRLGA